MRLGRWPCSVVAVAPTHPEMHASKFELGQFLKRRILVISAHESIIPPELMSADTEVISADDFPSGIAQAVALIPEYVVLRSTNNAVAIVNEILDRLPPNRHPSFLIAGSQQLDDAQPLPVTPETVRGAVQAKCHGLELDRRKLQATIDGRELTLTLMEFEILWVLASNPGHVQTRGDLVTACRREKSEVGRRTVDQHIRSLRKKLKARGDIIETVRGLGYRFRDCQNQEFINGCITC